MGRGTLSLEVIKPGDTQDREGTRRERGRTAGDLRRDGGEESRGADSALRENEKSGGGCGRGRAGDQGAAVIGGTPQMPGVTLARAQEAWRWWSLQGRAHPGGRGGRASCNPTWWAARRLLDVSPRFGATVKCPGVPEDALRITDPARHRGWRGERWPRPRRPGHGVQRGREGAGTRAVSAPARAGAGGLGAWPLGSLRGGSPAPGRLATPLIRLRHRPGPANPAFRRASFPSHRRDSRSPRPRPAPPPPLTRPRRRYHRAPAPCKPLEPRP